MMQIIENKIYEYECTGNETINPYVAVTDLRSSLSCDIEVVKSNKNIQETTIDKLMDLSRSLRRSEILMLIL